MRVQILQISRLALQNVKSVICSARLLCQKKARIILTTDLVEIAMNHQCLLVTVREFVLIKPAFVTCITLESVVRKI